MSQQIPTFSKYSNFGLCTKNINCKLDYNVLPHPKDVDGNYSHSKYKNKKTWLKNREKL